MKPCLILPILLITASQLFGTGQIHVRWKTPAMPFPPPLQAGEQFGTGTSGAGNTDLNWIVLIHGDVPRPMALVVHAGEFKELTPGPIAVARDLYYAGYNAAAIQYRLADPGYEMRRLPFGTQPDADHGSPPEQTDDISQAIIAARTGSTAATSGQVTGQVVAVGGSAGGAHVAWFVAAADHGGDKLDAGVSLSGAYAFADAASWPVRCGHVDFGSDVHNYVNCTLGDPACDNNPGGLLDAASPINRFGPLSSPFYLIETNLDHMPPGQFSLMITKLTFVAAPFQSRIITETPDPDNGCTRHSFNFWYADPGSGLSQEAMTDSIAFLQSIVPTP